MLRLFLTALLLSGSAPPAGAQERPSPPPGPRQVAVTFDDLPVASVAADDLARHRAVTEGLLRAISREGIPAVGFVNEGKLSHGDAVDPARVALLQRWLDAGLELGNHTHSHLDLHAADPAEYEAARP